MKRYFIVLVVWSDGERAYSVLQLDDRRRPIARHGIYIGQASQTDLIRAYSHYVTALLQPDEIGIIHTNHAAIMTKPHKHDFAQLHYTHKNGLSTRFAFGQATAVEALYEKRNIIEIKGDGLIDGN